MMNLADELYRLCNAPTVPGDEQFGGAYALGLLRQFMPADYDSTGSIIGENNGEGNGIILEAHLDTIGMIVTGVEDNGFVHADKCGGVDIRTLAAHDVLIHGKETVHGVITSIPPHLSKDSKIAADFTELMIDTGLTDGRAKEIISLGDRITFKAQYARLLGENLCGAYFDNNAGICAVLRCLEILRERGCNKKIYVVFSSQEETGGTGARAFGFRCPAPECICVDVTFAKTKDTPKSIIATLGGGTMIGVAPALDNRMTNILKATARNKGIPFGLEVMGGGTGTDADKLAVSREGKRTALLSIPIKNMHTPVEVVSLDDIQSTALLMADYIMYSGGGKV